MYYVKIATSRFRCHASDERINPGDAYLEDGNGYRYHMNQLPARKLIPLKEYLNANKTGKQELVSR